MLFNLIIMDFKQLGKTIKAKREIANISQEKLAAIAAVSLKTVYRIENGLKDPKLSSIYTIAKALNLKLADLFKEI